MTKVEEDDSADEPAGRRWWQGEFEPIGCFRAGGGMGAGTTRSETAPHDGMDDIPRGNS